MRKSNVAKSGPRQALSYKNRSGKVDTSKIDAAKVRSTFQPYHSIIPLPNTCRTTFEQFEGLELIHGSHPPLAGLPVRRLPMPCTEILQRPGRLSQATTSSTLPGRSLPTDVSRSPILPVA